VTSIPPPGQSIDNYPGSVLTQTQLDIREKAKLLVKYIQDKLVISNLVEKHLLAAPAFWAAHFGLNPQEGMVTAVDGAGTALKPALFKLSADGTLPELTPKEKLAIADEVMNYANPSAEENNVKKESVLVIISALPQKYNIEAKMTELTNEMKIAAEEVIYKLEGKPDPDSYKIFFDGMKTLPTAQLDFHNANYIPTPWQKSWGYVTFTHTTTGAGTLTSKHDLVRNKNNLSSSTSTVWKAGSDVEGINFHVKAIQQFYFDAYAGDPKHFWDTIATHRLVVELDSDYSMYFMTVRMVKVNPNTGAPKSRGTVVATARRADYNHSGGYRLLSEVQQKMFPDVVISEPGKNPKVLTPTETYYAKELLSAQQIWKSTPRKDVTPMVGMVIQDWKMPIMDQSYGTQQDLTSLQSRMVLSYRGLSTDRTKSVYATGPVSQMPTKPLAIMQVRYYLQAPGAEDAMRRLLIGSDDNPSAPELWKEEMNPSATHYTNVIKGVYAILDNPWAYMRSIDDLFNYKARVPGAYYSSHAHLTAEEIFGSYASDILSKNSNGRYEEAELNSLLTSIGKVFVKAGWPTEAPRLLFAAPVNDEQDLLFIRTKLNQALEGADYPKPREMYLPETINRKLNSDGTFSNGLGPRYKADTKRYFYNQQHVYYHSLYTMSGVTIRTRKRIGKIQPMTDIVSKARASQDQMGSLNDLNTAGTIGVIGGGFALIALGYAVSRNRSR
jgi:hypothetical protein